MPLGAADTPRGATDTPCGAADTSRIAVDTATFIAFTSFLANFENFSAFLGAKKHFFQKVLKKWSSIQKKIENIFITFWGRGVRPQSDKNHFFFFEAFPFTQLIILNLMHYFINWFTVATNCIQRHILVILFLQKYTNVCFCSGTRCIKAS